MKWLLYNVLFAVGYTLMLPKFFWRMWRRGGYRRGFAQRLGWYDRRTKEALNGPSRLWVHAVSVGEIFIAFRLMDELRALYPNTGFVVTTTTSTGHRLAAQRVQADDVLLYFPSDFPWVVKRVLRVLRPRALILTECELWPNLIRFAHRLGVPTVLMNGRISESSFRGYWKLRFFFRDVVHALSLCLVQTERERAMLAQLGADDRRVHVLGSVKYDVAQRQPEREEQARRWLARFGVQPSDPILLGGSTWPGEETVLLACFQSLRKTHPGLKLVLIPRHAERRGEIEAGLKAMAMPYVKRSDTGDSSRDTDQPVDVFVVDTTGELMGFYACATVVFVGKSLTQHGGQNIIEPALLEKPVVVGPNMENFPDVVPEFLAAEALIQVPDAGALGDVLKDLFADPASCRAYGERAGELVRSRQGVIHQSAELIQQVIDAR